MYTSERVGWATRHRTAWDAAPGRTTLWGHEDDGGDDLRTKMELHPKSVIWQAELLGDKSNFSAERLRAAHLEVQKQLTRASKRAGE